MKCVVCSPSCARCKPAFVVCESCGKRNLMGDTCCVLCGATISREAKKQARDDWKLGSINRTRAGFLL